MREKIANLAKGMIDTDTPIVSVNPRSISETVNADESLIFSVEVFTEDKCNLRGICFCDEVRLSLDKPTFGGRRIYINFTLNTRGLNKGDILSGKITIDTNGGEFNIPYSFTIGTDRENHDIHKSTHSEVVYSPNPLTYYYGSNDSDYDNASRGDTKLPKTIPTDNIKFAKLTESLIRDKDESPEAFSYYEEAISRNLSITHLYESYMYAFPVANDMPIPREVLLYFSYDLSLEELLSKKLYANLLKFPERNEDIYAIYESRIGSFAMNEILKGLIDEDLAIIYDRVLSPDMVDFRIADTVYNIFNTHEFIIEAGNAAKISVSYPEINNGIECKIVNNKAFVPIYMEEAVINFYDENAICITKSVSYSEKVLFNRTDIIAKCVLLSPDMDELLLKKSTKILTEGIKDADDKLIVIDALKKLDLNRNYRASFISLLCHAEGDMGWISVFRSEDYTFEMSGNIVLALTKAGLFKDAYALIKEYGVEICDIDILGRILGGLLAKGDVNIDIKKPEDFFIKLCKKVYDNKKYTVSIIEVLAKYYNGSSLDMLSIARTALKKKARQFDLIERVITLMLFSECKEQIDEAFSLYVDHYDYKDIMVRAYLTSRCRDYFLDELDVDESVFDSLMSYIGLLKDTLNCPRIYMLALTKFFSSKESLSDRETELCQLFTDKLISENLIFEYTKRLKNKINIPEEICNKFYIEYHSLSNYKPKLLLKILPDDEDYHMEDMKCVYRNIFVLDIYLFKGDELHYIIYDKSSDDRPNAEGMINATKTFKTEDKRPMILADMMQAVKDKDMMTLRTFMLKYIETEEAMKLLYKME